MIYTITLALNLEIDTQVVSTYFPLLIVNTHD